VSRWSIKTSGVRRSRLKVVVDGVPNVFGRVVERLPQVVAKLAQCLANLMAGLVYGFAELPACPGEGMVLVVPSSLRGSGRGKLWPAAKVVRPAAPQVPGGEHNHEEQEQKMFHLSFRSRH